tara:strand:- start:81 stop:245 length:165 start_codon:yes stop_codon:yes gene_type:complete
MNILSAHSPALRLPLDALVKMQALRFFNKIALTYTPNYSNRMNTNLSKMSFPMK